MHAIGIDIGGTKIAGALVDVDGTLVKELRVPTPGNDPIALTEAVANLINVLSEGESVVGAGVAAAGFIDADQANIIYAPNIAWRNEPFKANLEKLVKVPVLLENDANAAGWAEYRYGAGKGTKHMVMLTLGTGVGGAVVVEDNNIPIGYVQAAILDLFKVLVYQDFTIKWGWEDDDFTKNLITVIGEMRIHSFHSENNAGAFIYDTFANIKTAIEAPVV